MIGAAIAISVGLGVALGVALGIPVGVGAGAIGLSLERRHNGAEGVAREKKGV